MEHVEGDNTKFGLRRGSLPNNDNTTIFKAKDEPNRILWVKTLREIMHDMKKLSIGKDVLNFLGDLLNVYFSQRRPYARAYP